MAKTGDPRARTSVTVPSAAPGDLPKNSFMLVLTGTRFGELYKLPPGRVVRIGRGEEADIRLDDEGISRLHCSLEARGPEAVLRDLGSQNGTYVGGERTQEKVLGDGDRVNEAHGRPAGDEVLRGVAQVLQGIVRGADVVARVGGDEFAILVRETELQGAQTLAERLRQSIEEMRTRFDGKEIAVTATFGIAVDVPSHKRENEQPRHLVEHAERALERQKELGVNRTGN